MQKALARLLADAQLRESFFKDPQGVGRELGFSAEETRRLAEISPRGLNTFASYLHKKWYAQLGKLMPLTFRALGDRFTFELRKFSETHLPGGVKRIMEDALAFNLHLGKALKQERERRWILDLLRYERARLRAADPRRRLVVSVFRYDISRLVRSLARQEDADVFPRRCAALWTRYRRGQKVRYVVIMLPQMGKEKAASSQ